MDSICKKAAGAAVRIAAQLMHQIGGAPYGVCRFHPSCQEYANEAFRTLPVFKAAGKTLWRILRCNPFSRGGYDPPAQ